MSQQVEVLKEKVERYVSDLVRHYDIDEEGVLDFRWGSAHVFLRCMPFAGEWSIVSISMPVLFGLAPTPELFREVALRAGGYHFGHLNLVEEDGGDRVKLLLKHTLLGDYLDVEELKGALEAMTSTADDLDDELKQRFGGVRYHED